MNKLQQEIDRLKVREQELLEMCRKFRDERDELAGKLATIGELTYPYGHRSPCGDECTL